MTLTSSRRRTFRGGMAALSAAALLLAGCANNTEGGAGGGAPAGEAEKVEAVSAIANKVPQKYKDSGKLIVGTNTPYAPNEFKDSSGKIIGFDVDLVNAVAATMGLTAEVQESDFDKIIPAIEGGTLDLGISSMTVNPDREKIVDMARYFNAGTQWVAQAGKTVDPDDACGKKVAVQRTTVQDTEDIPARSKKCTDAGKPAIQKMQFDEQDLAANAVALGQADAFSADSPVSAYAVKQSDGKLELVGEIFDAAPYGISVKKDSELGPVVVEALAHLAKNGQSKKIAERWGLTEGVLDTPSLGK